ncbi:MAG: FixH family protein [Acidobacteriota bacterium]|nr:MAG: FixH family protein [Acidobacteriota bacterium]
MKPHIVWISIIVGLLALSVVVHGILLVAALSDPSFAVEPDYEAKAANFDAIQRQRWASQRLGWTTELRTRPAVDPGEVEISLEAFDRDGEPIRDAAVELETFHNARAAEVINGRLTHIREGRYRGVLPMTRSGVWEIRLTITSEDDVYVRTLRKNVLSTPRFHLAR